MEEISIKDWHVYLNNVLCDINICLNNIRILEIEFNNNNSKILNNLPFFKNYFYQQKFILIVQLDKIFSDNERTQKFNIHKLIKYLDDSNNEEVQELIKLNSKKVNDVFTTIDRLSSDLKIIKERLTEKKNLFDTLNKSRSKIYAHTDKIDLHSNDYSISYKEFETLKDLGTDIYNKLLGKIFDKYFHFQLTEEYDVRNLIK